MTAAGTLPSAEDVARLAHALEGSVIDRSAADYEAHRVALVWNGRVPDRHPDLIVKALSVQDVGAALAFARRHRLPVCAKGSGHSYSAIFLREGGMLLDLSALNGVVVDRSARLLSVGPGATSAQIDTALAEEGLAFPVGHGGPVGIGGFLLGGGLGINCAAWGGMSTFNILAADVMTADGRILRTSPDENTDLYWALRGGGPGLPFIVTRFELRCYDRPGHISVSTYLARFSDLPELAERIDAAAPALDLRLQLMLAIVPAPAEVAGRCSQDDHGRAAVLTAIAFADNAAEARSLHAALAEAATALPLLDHSANEAIGFADIFASTDQLLVSRRVRADNILTDRLGEAVRILMRQMPDSPSPASVAMIVRRADTAFADGACSLAGRYFLSTYAQWDHGKDDDANAAWLLGLHDELAGIATGAYVNEFDLEARSDTIEHCIAAANLERLRDIRHRHDPEGVFHYPFAKGPSGAR